MPCAEPVAAVMAYGHGRAREDSLVLVVDLGGGTYDVSLIECFEGKLQPFKPTLQPLRFPTVHLSSLCLCVKFIFVSNPINFVIFALEGVQNLVRSLLGNQVADIFNRMMMCSKA